MTDCCDESCRLTQSAGASDMFILVDDDLDDVVTCSMSFRRCPVVRGPRRSFLHRASNSTDSISRGNAGTVLNHFTDGMTAGAVDSLVPVPIIYSDQAYLVHLIIGVADGSREGRAP